MIRIIDSAEHTLAFLNNLVNPKIREVINGEYTFSFTTIIEELKSDYINHNNLINIDGQIFQITIYSKERTLDNQLLISGYAEQVSYKLIEYKLPSFSMENCSALVMLTALLDGTEFSLGNVTVAGLASVNIDMETNKREVLNEIGNAFGGEFEFDGYTINFLAQRGQNKGVEFRIGKNMLSIKKTIDNTVKDEDGNPSVTYEVNVAELNEIEAFKGIEGFEIGDTVKIIDEDLGIEVNARILEYEYDPIFNTNSRVVFGNFIENIVSLNASLFATSNLVSKRSVIWERAKAISESGTVFTSILEGEINTLQNVVKAGLGTVTATDHNGILVTDQPSTEQSTKALRLLGGVLAISNEKDANGNFIYRTFGTGDGFTADEIKTGILSADRIGAGSLTLEKLSGDVPEKISLAIGDTIDLSSNPLFISYGNDISTIDGKVTTHETLIQQNTQQISLKVAKNNIISEINQSAEAIKINANKVDITGFVTINDLATAGATTINGANISTGSLTAINEITIGLLSSNTTKKLIFHGGNTNRDSTIESTVSGGYSNLAVKAASISIIGWDGGLHTNKLDVSDQAWLPSNTTVGGSTIATQNYVSSYVSAQGYINQSTADSRYSLIGHSHSGYTKPFYASNYCYVDASSNSIVFRNSSGTTIHTIWF